MRNFSNYFYIKPTFTILLFCLLAIVANAQHDKLQLTFSVEGKLLSGYLPRYNPNICKDDCKNDKSLAIRVLLPTNYLDKDIKVIDEKAKEAYIAINEDSQSMLYKILNCDNEDLTKAKNIIIKDKDRTKWKIDDKNSIIPPELIKYVNFINYFKNGEIDNLNVDKEKTFIPFGLKIKGYEIDNSCISFEKVNTKTDNCDCIKNKREDYVALIFNIPSGFVTKEIALDSFELIRKYKMKEVAIAWYNKMLDENKDSIAWLKLFEQKIRKQQANVTPLLAKIDSLSTLTITCKDEVQLIGLREQINAKICSYTTIINEELGNFKNKENCFDKIFCSHTLRKWILKLIWLNGDKIQLNPFNFTTNNSFELRQSDANKKIEELKQKQDNARIQLNFWETAITHLKDSVQRVKTIDIDSNKVLLTKLLLQRDTAIAILAKKIPSPLSDEANSNTSTMKQFLTTSQVNYLGWIVPYEATDNNKAYKINKMWLRNYYYDQMPNPLREKLHFTYPENENVTLLVHNVPSSTGISVTESIKPFTDSAAFTIAAGEFVKGVAGLYGSLGTVAPLVKKLLGGLNVRTPANIPIDEISTLITESESQNNRLINNDEINRNLLEDNNGNVFSLALKNKNNIVIAKIDSVKRFNLNNNINEIVKNLIKVNENKQGRRIVKYTTIKIDTFKITGNESYIKDFNKIRNITLITATYKYSKKIDTLYKNNKPKNKINEDEIAKIKNKVSGSTSEVAKSICLDNTDTTYINYLQSLYSIAIAPTFIDTKMEAINTNTPIYHTDKYQLSNQEASYRNDYKVLAVTKKDGNIVSQIKIDSSYIKVGKFHYLQTVAGIAFTPNAGFITSVDTANGGFSINRDEDRFRLIVGLRWYPWGLYNLVEPTRNIFKDKRWLHRLSVLAATGIPKPFQNMYAGIGFDVVPGLNLSTGVHWQQQNSYSIVNNQVKDRNVGYKPNVFYAVTIDPNLFVTAIKSLVK